MKALKYVFFSAFLFFFGSPAYCSGYEDVSLLKTIFQLIFYLLVFVVVIFITLYGTKLIAKNYKGFNRSKYMEIIDLLNIQNGVKLAIVKVNNKIYILSISNAATTVIDTIDPEDLENKEFDTYFDKYINKKDQEFGPNLYINKIKDKLKFSKKEEDKR